MWQILVFCCQIHDLVFTLTNHAFSFMMKIVHNNNSTFCNIYFSANEKLQYC